MALDLYTELRRIVQALNEADVHYAVVGPVAVSLYAKPRATQDIDLLIPQGSELLWLLQDRTRATTGGMDLWVIGLRGLRTLKRLRGSAQDLADLEALSPEEGEDSRDV